MKNQKYHLALSIVLLISLVMATVSFSYGWFSNRYPLAPDLGFSTGSAGNYTMDKIVYTEGDNGNITVNISSDISELGTVFNSADHTKGSIDIGKLDFGKINNLSYLGVDNYIYYAIKINGTMGTKVNVGVSYNNDAGGSHFEIYTADGSSFTELNDADTLDSIRNIETESKTFISYAVALSLTAPANMTYDGMQELFATGDASSLGGLTGGKPTQRSYTIDGTPNEYYAYIKLQPNVDLYAGFIDHIEPEQMPFFLVYDVRIYFTVGE